jgi:hypothetical protein
MKILKKLSLLLVFWSATEFVIAQPYFSKRYPIANHLGAGGSNVIENGSGYFAVTTSISTLTFKRNIVIIQTDFEGNTLFEKIYGDTTYIYFAGFKGSLQKITTGGYIMYGGKQDINKNYDLLYRFNDVGDILWTKILGDTTVAYGHLGDNMKVTPDGGFICLGDRGSPSAPIFIIKTDSLGNKQWEQFYGGTEYDKPTSIALCSDGGYIYCSTTKSGGIGLPNNNIRVMKIDSLGNTVFNKFYGDVYNDNSHTIIQTQDGGYVVSMAYAVDTTIGTRTYASLLKLDSLGNLLWLKKVMPIQGNGPDGFTSVVELSDGSLVAAGLNHYTDSTGISRYHGLVVKTTSQGNIIWHREHNLSTTNTASSYLDDMRATSDGGFICSGVANTPQDLWLLKLDSLGCADTACTLATAVNEVRQLTDLRAFTLYPNPSNGLLTIKAIEKIEGNYQVEFYNTHGQRIITQKLTSDAISLNNFENGIYLVRVLNHSGVAVYTNRFILQK